MLFKRTFKGYNINIINVNNNKFNAWFKDLLKVKVFINIINNLIIIKKKVIIIKDIKERFKRKVKVKRHVLIIKCNNKVNNSNQFKEIINKIKLDPDREELKT